MPGRPNHARNGTQRRRNPTPGERRSYDAPVIRAGRRAEQIRQKLVDAGLHEHSAEMGKAVMATLSGIEEYGWREEEAIARAVETFRPKNRES